MALTRVKRKRGAWAKVPREKPKRPPPGDEKLGRMGDIGPVRENMRKAERVRYEVRRICHAIIIVRGNDPDLVMEAVQKQKGVELSREQALALIAETRAWQREDHAQKSSTSAMDQKDRMRQALPELTGSSKVQAEALLARLEGNEAPVQFEHRHDFTPDVLAVLKASSPEEIERYVARALGAKKGGGE